MAADTSAIVNAPLAPTMDLRILYDGNFRVSNALRILVEVLSFSPASAFKTPIAFFSSAVGVL